MNTWIAFLRGINVGGHNKLPMKELVDVLQGSGCADVKTYVQSGNVVFRHPERDHAKLSHLVGSAIGAGFGFEPAVLMLTKAQLEVAVENNPFPDGERAPKTLHLSFLAAEARNADIDGMTALKSETETFELTKAVFYLHAPDGIGRSKLAAKVEKLLGVPTTARNWNTVRRVLELAR